MALALVLLLIGIAVWRAALMLWKENGPLDIFARSRAYLAKKQKHSGGLYDLVSCFLCLSMWVSMIPALFLATSFVTFVFYTLVFSGVALIIQNKL